MSCLRHGAKVRKGLDEHIIRDLGSQVTHKDMKVARGISLLGLRALSPVQADVLIDKGSILVLPS